MDTPFKEAPEVQYIAEQLIEKYPEQHEHLKDLFTKNLIQFFFRSDDPDWAGKCKKCTKFEQEITGKIIFIFINQSWWDRTRSSAQQDALVDHELCHIGRKDDAKEYFKDTDTFGRWNPADNPDSWYIIEHDVEEFAGVVERHGLWERGIEKVVTAGAVHERQITLGEFTQDGVVNGH